MKPDVEAWNLTPSSTVGSPPKWISAGKSVSENRCDFWFGHDTQLHALNIRSLKVDAVVDGTGFDGVIAWALRLPAIGPVRRSADRMPSDAVIRRDLNGRDLSVIGEGIAVIVGCGPGNGDDLTLGDLGWSAASETVVVGAVSSVVIVARTSPCEARIAFATPGWMPMSANMLIVNCFSVDVFDAGAIGRAIVLVAQAPAPEHGAGAEHERAAFGAIERQIVRGDAGLHQIALVDQNAAPGTSSSRKA